MQEQCEMRYRMTSRMYVLYLTGRFYFERSDSYMLNVGWNENQKVLFRITNVLFRQTKIEYVKTTLVKFKLKKKIIH